MDPSPESGSAVFTNHDGSRSRRLTYLPDPPLDLFGGKDGTAGLETLLEEVARVLDMDLVLLGHVDADRYTTLAAYSRNPALTLDKGFIIPIGNTYCREEITADKPFVLGDATLDPRFAEHPGYKVYGLRSYVGTPLRLPDGTLFGTLCGVDTRPHLVSLAAVERLVALSREVTRELLRRMARGRPGA